MSDQKAMQAEVLEVFFAHNAWANLRLLEFCERLSDEQLDSAVLGGYGSIRDTLWHILNAEVGYVERSIGSLPPRPLVAGQPLDFAQLKEVAAWASDAILRMALDAGAGGLVRQRPPRPPLQFRMASLIVQAITHSAEHRAQITAIITQLHLEPPDLSIWQYIQGIGEIQEFSRE